MKAKAAIAAIVAIAVASLAAVMAAPPARKRGMPMISYSLKVSIASTTLRAAHPLDVRVVLKNVSSKEVQVGQRSLIFDYRYDLTSNGAAVAMTRFGEQGQAAAKTGTASAALRVLAPGQELVTEVPLARIFDLSTAGKYRLVVARDLPMPPDGAWAELRSDPLEFELSD